MENAQKCPHQLPAFVSSLWGHMCAHTLPAGITKCWSAKVCPNWDYPYWKPFLFTRWAFHSSSLNTGFAEQRAHWGWVSEEWHLCEQHLALWTGLGVCLFVLTENVAPAWVCFENLPKLLGSLCCAINHQVVFDLEAYTFVVVADAHLWICSLPTLPPNVPAAWVPPQAWVLSPSVVHLPQTQNQNTDILSKVRILYGVYIMYFMFPQYHVYSQYIFQQKACPQKLPQ